jgi:predicted DNA-binding transcriptional regulator YafY
MPTNLNALIRYKTINNCLSTGRGYSKQELASACTEALKEYRDRKVNVSTRTIEDDISKMRGSHLGMEAPIVIKNGLYFYSDPSYHLANVLFTDEGIIRKTIDMLLGLLEKSYDQELENLIEQLQGILVKNKVRESYYYKREFEEEALGHGIPGLQQFSLSDSMGTPSAPRIPMKSETIFSAPTWGEVFKVIFKDK